MKIDIKYILLFFLTIIIIIQLQIIGLNILKIIEALVEFIFSHFEETIGLFALLLTIISLALTLKTAGQSKKLEKAVDDFKDLKKTLRDIQQTEKDFEKTLSEIKDTEKDLKDDITNLEDATRRNLKGFVEIFSRSLWLLEQAEEKIIYLNFVLGFGDAHKLNDKLQKHYNELEKKPRKIGKNGEFGEEIKTFEDAINYFSLTLQQKSSDKHIKNIKIVTLEDNKIKSDFFATLSQRTDKSYDYLKETEIKNKKYQDECDFRKTMLSTLKTRQELKETGKENLEQQWLAVSSIPIQVLIAGLPSRKGGSTDMRYGCVVFLLGTESLKGVKEPGQENGFYTELTHIINMYEDLVNNVTKEFKPIFSSKNQERYRNITNDK